jgi:hypothetical protein
MRRVEITRRGFEAAEFDVLYVYVVCVLLCAVVLIIRGRGGERLGR